VKKVVTLANKIACARSPRELVPRPSLCTFQSGGTPDESCQAIPKQDTPAKKTWHLGSKFSAGFGWFGTQFPHTTRTLTSHLPPAGSGAGIDHSGQALGSGPQPQVSGLITAGQASITAPIDHSDGANPNEPKTNKIIDGQASARLSIAERTKAEDDELLPSTRG
jgi:hypothetical protein